MFGGGLIAAAAFPKSGFGQTSSGWTDEWNTTVVRAAVNRFAPNFSEKESLLSTKLGSGYRIHTNLRDTIAHHTRESLEYALFLLETGDEAAKTRAVGIIERVISLQNTDPNSKFYGLWGWYAEEPPEKMLPADFNWANFNGAWLLLIYLRHNSVLPAKLGNQIKDAIRHAALSIERRNVSPFYTNIAVKGAFVNCCAGEILDDQKIGENGLMKLREFARTLDRTGSFSEYNSPTYTWVTLSALTRLKTYAKRAEVLDLADKLHHRLWEHIAAHWHAPTAQFAAPMSRCYATDAGFPLWLQKSLGNRLQFLSLADIKAGKISAESGEAGISNFQCPPDLLGKFLRFGGAKQHREIFIAGDTFLDDGAVGASERPNPVRPVQGTSFFAPEFTLGTANRSDFWIQRRPLVLYWGDNSRPARYLQLRVVKDNYDFASALFYSVQHENCIIAAVNFRNPGGDKHPTVDPLPNGEFNATRIFLQFLFNGLRADAPVLVNGSPLAKVEKLPRLDQTRLTFETETCRLAIQPRFAKFGKHIATLRFEAKKNGQSALELDLLSKAGKISWATVEEALAVFTIHVEAKSKHASLAEFDAATTKQNFEKKVEKDRVNCVWESAAGKLELVIGRQVQPIAAHDAIFSEKLNGKDVPLFQLSETRLIA